MTLNPDQARIVAIRLRMLEQDLAEVGRLMNSDEAGRLYRRDRPEFTRVQRATIATLLEDIRAVIGAIADGLGLPLEDQDSRKRIQALLGLGWESVGEMNTRRIAAYGETDPRLAGFLDPAVAQLGSLILELQDETGSSPLRPGR